MYFNFLTTNRFIQKHEQVQRRGKICQLVNNPLEVDPQRACSNEGSKIARLTTEEFAPFINIIRESFTQYVLYLEKSGPCYKYYKSFSQITDRICEKVSTLNEVYTLCCNEIEETTALEGLKTTTLSVDSDQSLGFIWQIAVVVLSIAFCLPDYFATLKTMHEKKKRGYLYIFVWNC